MYRRRFIKIAGTGIIGAPFYSLFSKNGIDLSLTDGNDKLFQAFQNPDGQAKPFVRWWWNGLRITKEEIVRELDMLQQMGIGGVEINSIRFPETAEPMAHAPIQWLGEEWLEMVEFTVKEAREKGIVCDILVGSGFPFGGEFLPREDQTVLMALGTMELTGPRTITLTKEELENNVNPPIGFKYKNPLKELAAVRLVPKELAGLHQVKDLDTEIVSGKITIDIPEGSHVLYSLVKITGFMAVIHGAPGADGPVLNHYKKDAVERYLHRMSDTITAKIGSLGDNFRSIFIDSIELEGANWVDDFYEEFEKRRKYSLIPYLPFILFKTGKMGKALEEEYGADFTNDFRAETERVRYDFEVTKQELFTERFINTFLEWCKKNNVKSRLQPYGQEMHPLDASLDVDIPECETWITRATGSEPQEFNFTYATPPCMVNRFVSSAARFSGKNLISCEEITNTQFVFGASLEHIKVCGDQSNLSGVTHSILHGFNYSPPDVPFPGWIRYGTYFNEQNPWWPYLNRWINYKSRLSAVFQRANLMSDVVLFHPLADLWSKYGIQRDPWPDRRYPDYIHNIWQAVHQCGNGCDYISDQILQKSDFSDGKINFNDRSYSLLLVVEAETMHEDTARALKEYADAGGRLVFIGKTPHKSPGFSQHEQRDKEVKQIIAKVEKGERVKHYPVPQKETGLISWFQGIQEMYNLPRYVSFEKSVNTLSQVYYKYGDLDIFFICNSHISKTETLMAEFHVAKDKTAWLWDTETGNRSVYKSEGVPNRLKLRLSPAQSLLIVFDKNTPGRRAEVYDYPHRRQLQALDGFWNLTLNYVDGKKEVIQNFKLTDFKEDENLKKFSGNAVYELSVRIDDVANYNYLDLGKVFGISEVMVNGKNIGVCWYGDHIYNVKNVLKKGDNSIRIKLTTTLANFMNAHPEIKDAKKWVVDRKQPVYSCGITGPVSFLA